MPVVYVSKGDEESTQPVEGKVVVEDKHGNVLEDTAHSLGKIVIQEATANVGVTVGHTKNLGNYESVRVQVSLHMPAAVDEVDDAFKFASGWVDGKMSEVLGELSGVKNSQGMAKAEY